MKIKTLNQYHIEVLTQALSLYMVNLNKQTAQLNVVIEEALHKQDYLVVKDCGGELHELSNKTKNVTRFLKNIVSDFYAGMDIQHWDWHDYCLPNIEMMESFNDWAASITHVEYDWTTNVSDKIREHKRLLLATSQVIYTLTTGE